MNFWSTKFCAAVLLTTPRRTYFVGFVCHAKHTLKTPCGTWLKSVSRRYLLLAQYLFTKGKNVKTRKGLRWFWGLVGGPMFFNNVFGIFVWGYGLLGGPMFLNHVFGIFVRG